MVRRSAAAGRAPERGPGSIIDLKALLPQGGSLPENVWRRRHAGIVALLWAHVPGILVMALATGNSLGHGLFEVTPVIMLAMMATFATHHRAISTVAAATGLLTCSAVLVHLSDGLIELHFHFFVMVGVVVLYQEWIPFLAAIGYVVLHHGIAGALDPGSVYNHPAAVNSPWKWAGIHGSFILAMSVAGIAAWRLNEALRSDAVDGQQKLAEAQDVARLGSWEWNVEADALIWSAQHYALFGVTEDDFDASYHGVIERIHPEDRELVDGAVQGAIETGTPFAVDFRTVWPDGSIHWLHGRGAVVERRAGQPVRLCGTAHDIDEHKRSEDVIRRSEGRYRHIIETTQEGVLTLDGENRMTFVNERMADLLGYAVDELLGVPLLRFMDDEGRRIGASVLERRNRLGEQHDLKFVRKDGSELWTLVSTTPLDDQEGDGSLLAMVSDITGRKQAEADLAHQALHDHLTGLPNRVLLLDRLEQALSRAERTSIDVAVVFMDLDRFKLINDTFGHETGDLLLVAVAERLQATFRTADTIARFGGDEFVLLFEGAEDERAVTAISEQILAALVERFTIRSETFHVSASLGVAVGAGPASSPQELIRDADTAMYRAKEQSRGRYEIFNENTRERALRRLHVENGLRAALDENELRVYYQPLVSVDDGHIIGAEALLRWQHPERGLILPSTFIPVAEDSGLIVPIGAWVLEEACRQARQWHELLERDEPLEVSVNLSARQLLQSELQETVANALDASAVEPGQVSLCLEVTETAVMENPDACAAALERLKELGVRVGMDDFGTGYSSLAYLRRFPFDIIKIDRAFITGLANSPHDQAILKSIVELARALGLTAVAEGVETPEQAAQLRRLGCEFAQGFLFAKPQPAEAVTTLLLAEARRPQAAGR